jgi:hypothetical protein
MRSGKIWIFVALAALVALVGYAWVDGGREPLREIAVDVPVPGAGR